MHTERRGEVDADFKSNPPKYSPKQASRTVEYTRIMFYQYKRHSHQFVTMMPEFANMLDELSAIYENYRYCKYFPSESFLRWLYEICEEFRKSGESGVTLGCDVALAQLRYHLGFATEDDMLQLERNAGRMFALTEVARNKPCLKSKST